MTTTEIYQSQAEKQFRIWSETDRMTNANERTAYVRACTDMEKVAIAYGEWIRGGAPDGDLRTSQQLFENFITNIYGK